MDTNVLDEDDLLAAQYLSGTDKFRQEMAAQIARLPHTPMARIFAWACTVIVIALLVAITWSAYVLEETHGMRLKWEIVVIFNLMGAAGIFKVWATYHWSRPRVYHLLQRFALRHPNSPHILRLRDAKGEIDWSKVEILTPKK